MPTAVTESPNAVWQRPQCDPGDVFVAQPISFQSQSHPSFHASMSLVSTVAVFLQHDEINMRNTIIIFLVYLTKAFLGAG